MSMHKIPLTDLERRGLEAHGLDIGTPSQLSDVFRHGVAWALAQKVERQRYAMAEKQSSPVEVSRDLSGSLIRLAARLLDHPIRTIGDLLDEDRRITRSRVSAAADRLDADIKDAAYEIRQIANALSALAAPARPACKTPSDHDCLGDGVGCCKRCPDAAPVEQQGEPVAYADPKAFINFTAGIATHEWMWAFADAGLVPLYRHAQPPDKAGPWEPLSAPGQIKPGDWLHFTVGGKFICTKAKEILEAGTHREEVVYNRSRNHYFITGMAVDGTSPHKGVMIAKP